MLVLFLRISMLTVVPVTTWRGKSGVELNIKLLTGLQFSLVMISSLI